MLRQLQHWWLDYAYLYQREPISPSLAFAGPFTLSETLWPPGQGTQCQVGTTVLGYTAARTGNTVSGWYRGTGVHCRSDREHSVRLVPRWYWGTLPPGQGTQCQVGTVVLGRHALGSETLKFRIQILTMIAMTQCL